MFNLELSVHKYCDHPRARFGPKETQLDNLSANCKHSVEFFVYDAIKGCSYLHHASAKLLPFDW